MGHIPTDREPSDTEKSAAKWIGVAFAVMIIGSIIAVIFGGK